MRGKINTKTKHNATPHPRSRFASRSSSSFCRSSASICLRVRFFGFAAAACFASCSSTLPCPSVLFSRFCGMEYRFLVPFAFFPTSFSGGSSWRVAITVSEVPTFGAQRLLLTLVPALTRKIFYLQTPKLNPILGKGAKMCN